MVSEFAAAALALDTGAITTEPVKTQFGWHVIKVEDKRDKKPPTFEEASGDLRDAAARDVISGLIKELRGQAQINIVEPKAAK